MPDTKKLTLTVTLEDLSLPAADFYDSEQWENEGGAAGGQPTYDLSRAPVRHGDIFEVKRTRLITRNDKLYIEAEASILDRDY